MNFREHHREWREVFSKSKAEELADGRVFSLLIEDPRCVSRFRKAEKEANTVSGNFNRRVFLVSLIIIGKNKSGFSKKVDFSSGFIVVINVLYNSSIIKNNRTKFFQSFFFEKRSSV